MSLYVPIKLETENDVYFGISCIVLSYTKKKQFLPKDIAKELKLLGWNEAIFKKWNVQCKIKDVFKNLTELGRIIELSRWYELNTK